MTSRVLAPAGMRNTLRDRSFLKLRTPSNNEMKLYLTVALTEHAS